MKRIDWNQPQYKAVGGGLLILLIGGVIGYRVGLSSKPPRRGSSLKSLQAFCSADRSRGYRGYEDRDDTDGRSPASLGSDSDYYLLLKKDRLEDRDRRLSAFFPRSDIGRILTQVTTLLEFGPNLELPEGRIVAEALKQLESQPNETFDYIRDALARFGSEFSAERQFLIHLIGQLDLEVAAKTDFLTEELSKNYMGSKSKQIQFNRAVALSTLIQLGTDPTTVEVALRQALSYPATYTSRLLLIGIYESKFPEQARKIKTDLGIDPP